jgi:hypothetical protein
LAVKVTLVPGQITPAGLATMETEGITVAFTVIVIALLVAVDGDAQAAFEVMTQVTKSPFARAAFV